MRRQGSANQRRVTGNNQDADAPAGKRIKRWRRSIQWARMGNVSDVVDAILYLDGAEGLSPGGDSSRPTEDKAAGPPHGAGRLAQAPTRGGKMKRNKLRKFAGNNRDERIGRTGIP